MTRCPKCQGRAVVLAVYSQGRGTATFGCTRCHSIWTRRWPTAEAIETAMRLAITEASASASEEE